MLSVPMLGPKGDDLDAIRYGLFLVSLLASIFYLGRTGGAWYPLMPWLKAVPVGLLAVLVLISIPLGSGLGLLLLAALVLSTAGDVFLALEDDKKWFVPGLGSFLLAHVAYSAIFALVLTKFPMQAELWRFAVIGVAVLLAVGLFVGLKGNMGDLAAPVGVYMAVILVMVSGALLVPATTPWIAAGALLFMGSDALIAVARFGTPFGGIHHIIWASYYVGQFFLMVGILRG